MAMVEASVPLHEYQQQQDHFSTSSGFRPGHCEHNPHRALSSTHPRPPGTQAPISACPRPTVRPSTAHRGTTIQRATPGRSGSAGAVQVGGRGTLRPSSGVRVFVPFVRVRSRGRGLGGQQTLRRSEDNDAAGSYAGRCRRLPLKPRRRLTPTTYQATNR